MQFISKRTIYTQQNVAIVGKSLSKAYNWWFIRNLKFWRIIYHQGLFETLLARNYIFWVASYLLDKDLSSVLKVLSVQVSIQDEPQATKAYLHLQG